MHVSEVLDIDSSFEKSRALVVGEKIVIQGFNVKNVEQVGSDVAEIKTTEGLRHSFGKAVIGQAKSKWWNETVEKCVSKDASDGLDVYVVEKEAEGTGRMMVSLSLYPSKD
jgi:hypothetical protein